MKIAISKKSLLEALIDVEKCVSKTEILPITAGVLIKTEKGHVSIASTDTEKGMKVKAECIVEKDGTAVIPFKKLIGIAKEVSSDKDIIISVADKRATVTSGHSKFNISLIEGDDFPMIVWEGGDEIVMRESDIKKISQYISVTTSNNAAGGFFGGINMLASGGKVRCYSTDKIRLSEFKCDYKGEGFETADNIIIPPDTLASISGIIGDGDGEVRVSTNGSLISFKTKDKAVYSRLLEGQYPEMSKRIPNNKHVISFSRNDLISVTRQVLPFITQDVYYVKMNVKKDKAQFIVKGESGDAEITIGITQVGGEEFTTIFNYDFLTSFIRVARGEIITMAVSDSKSGIVMRSNDEKEYLSVIVPLFEK